MSLPDTPLELNLPELKLRVLWLLVGFALVAFVVFLSLSSSAVVSGLSFPYEDKVYHAFAYFTLTFWFGQIYHDRSSRIIIAVLFLAMGLLMEYLQGFEPERMTEFADMVANAGGIFAGLLATMGRAKNMLHRLEAFIC